MGGLGGGGGGGGEAVGRGGGRDAEGEGLGRHECASSKREEGVASRGHTSGGADFASCRSFTKCLK